MFNFPFDRRINKMKDWIECIFGLHDAKAEIRVPAFFSFAATNIESSPKYQYSRSICVENVYTKFHQLTEKHFD